MSEPIRPPAVNPCGSCPYRKDVPSGVWDEEEYAKLPRYDGQTFEQPGGVFMCHQQDGRMCAGWCGTHDMYEAMSIRIAVIEGKIRPEDMDAILDYTTPVPLFSSGAEAAAHGRLEIEAPGEGAAKVIDTLTRKRGIAR